MHREICTIGLLLCKNSSFCRLIFFLEKVDANYRTIVNNGPWHKTRNMAQNNFTKTHVAVSVNQPNFIQGSLMDISLQLWSQFSGIFNLLSSQSSQNISKLHMATSYVVTLTSPRHAAKQYQTNSHFVSMKTQKWQIS